MRWPGLLALVLLAAGAGSRVAAQSTLEDYLDLFRDALTPAVARLFEDIRHDLASTAVPFPERVRARLRPFFAGTRAGDVTLSTTMLERARYAEDPEGARQLFALTTVRTAAITVGDVVAFAPGEYQPDCIEGVALIAHELVHVAQFHAMGRDRFLERYFLTETLERELGAARGSARDAQTNVLEVDAYCVQAEVCRALARTSSLPACRGRERPVCPACERRTSSADGRRLAGASRTGR